MNGEPYQSGERRPIASRERKSSRLIAAWLARRGVSPNAISIAGMVCGIASGCAFAATACQPGWQRWFWLAGAALAQLRLLANMFDGMVAIASQRASPVGELYNEIPDRISDAAIFIGLGHAVGGIPVLGYAATAAAIFTAYTRAMGKVAGAHQEFCGPMAKQHRMFLVTILGVYLGVAPEKWQPVWQSRIFGPDLSTGLAGITLTVIIAGCLLTSARRIVLIAAALKKPRS